MRTETTKHVLLPLNVWGRIFTGDLSVFSAEVGASTAELIGARVCELQADRKTASPRISASPESLMNAVKAGKLSLDQLKEAIAGLEG